MPEKVVPGPVNEERRIREAVCIHTRKIFDSCKDEDIAPLKLNTSSSLAALEQIKRQELSLLPFNII